MTRRNRTASSPLRDFAHHLRDLREAAGNPSYLELERRTGYAAAILAAAERGVRLPSLAVTQAYVGACGGDRDEWTRIWFAAGAELDEGRDDRAYDTVEFPRIAPAYQPPDQPPDPPPTQPPTRPPTRPKRRLGRLWVIVGALALAVGAGAAVFKNVSTVNAGGPEPTVQPTSVPTPAPTSMPTVVRSGQARPSPAFVAVAGPSCPRDASRSVRIDGLPGKDGWKDASVAGWTGADCGDSFLFSELTYDPRAATHPRNTFQWRFTTGLRGLHQCSVAVYVPRSGLAGQRVWYTVSDGFDEDAPTAAEFTLDQAMRMGTWVRAPVPITVTSGVVMVEIKDDGRGNTTGDQSMVAGPVRLACI